MSSGGGANLTSQLAGLSTVSREEEAGVEERQLTSFLWSEWIRLASVRLEKVTKAIPMALDCMAAFSSSRLSRSDSSCWR